MFSSFLGIFQGDEAAEETGVDKRFPLHSQAQDGDKASPLNASPASTATPGGAGGAESPLTVSPPRTLSGIRAPPGLDAEWQAVPPLPLAGKDDPPAVVRQVSLAEALLVPHEEVRRDPASPVVSLAAALPEPTTPDREARREPGTPVVSLSSALPEPEVGSEEMPTLGSRGHYVGMCKPCAFLHTKGCNNGKECPFCHLCERGAKKRRQRQRWQQKQVEYAFEHQSQVLSAAMCAMPMPMPLLPFPMVPPALDASLIDPTLFYMPTSPYGCSEFEFEAPMPVSLSDALAAP